MINMLRMDAHRFRTNKVMYLLLFVFFIFQVFGIFMLAKFGHYGDDGGSNFHTMTEIEFIQIFMSQTPSWVMLYIMVFSVYFYMSEYNSGFYKNIISMKRARLHSVLSKMIILGLFTALMLIVMLAADLIGRSLFLEHAALGDVGQLSMLLVGQFILHWAFAVVILCVAMLSRSMLASLIIGIVIVLNVVGMLLGALESLIGLESMRVSDYLLVNTISSPQHFAELGDVIHVVGVGVGFLLLFALIGIQFKLKEDLK